MLTLASALFIGVFILLLLRYVPLHKEQTALTKRQVRHLLKFYGPLKLLIITILFLYIGYGTLLSLPNFVVTDIRPTLPYRIATNITGFLLLAILYQLSITASQVIHSSLSTLPNRKARKLAVLMPVFAKAIKAVVLSILVRHSLQFLYTPTLWLPDYLTLNRLLLIVTIAWILLQLVNGLEAMLTLQYNPDLDENLDSRKTYTHIVIVKRLVLLGLAVLTIIAMMMTFEAIRKQGTALFVSGGLLTAILGISGKQPLEGLFRGLQLAITQPIRVNDTIIVEGELGVVELINFYHVIVTLWDKRQMIVPTSYFLETPFQNWTHNSNDLLGTIFFYVDYQLPIEPIRNQFLEYLRLNEQGLWNGHVSLLQVTEIKDQTVELRMLVSADNAEKLFDLRCEIREKMLYFIQKHYPEGLPKIRVDNTASL